MGAACGSTWSTPTAEPALNESDERAVGRVVRAHGLRGELVVESSTDHEDVRFAPGALLEVRPPKRAPAGLPTRLTVRAARHHGGRLLVTVDEVGDRDAAEALRTVTLVADPLDSPGGEADDPDEFGDHELEGCTVVLGDGTAVGTVRDVVHGAAGELLVVDTAEGAEVLVPFVAAIVVEVDRIARRVVLDPPEGLLDPGAT